MPPMGPKQGAIRLFAMAAVLWTAISAWKAGAFRPPDPLPGHVRHALVLDGQGPAGSRAEKGLDLLRRHLADTLVLSGTDVGGGVVYSMIWARMLPLDSLDRTRTVELRSGSSSTQDEARLADSLFHRMGDDTVMVVTSSFHAWRTASVFRRIARSGTVFVVVPSPDPVWDKGWMDREGRKMHLMEWTKRLYWTLWERWSPVQGPLPWHAFARGAELGRLPEPAWIR